MHNELSPRHVVIVAGGKGLRMGGALPKQFMPIGGKPVLMRTIERFREYDEHIHIVLVLPSDQHDYWTELCREHHFSIPVNVVAGGATRFHSSQNGVAAIEGSDDDLVAIHDGVRPFVSTDTIARCFDEAARSGAALPVLPVTDTLRYVGGEGAGHNVQRADYRVVQTPQTFKLELLRRAFAHPYSDAFTDDASVVEAAGGTVVMVEGNRDNIKLTTPTDLQLADFILSTAK